MPDSFPSPLLSPIFASEAVARIFSDRATLQAMLDFESALARAEAEAGIIPKEAAEAIAKACDAKLYDIVEIGRAAALAGNVAIPLVKALTADLPEPARGFVHWGATSQDVIDTAFMLCARPALATMRGDLQAAMQALVELIGAHRKTLMAGRTLMQQALPITFAYKAAIWLSGVTYAAERLRRVESESLALQFGGAVGTLAALGDKGLAVRKALAARLKLKEAALTWHAERGRIIDIAVALAGLSGAAAKIATDVILLMQTEVGEVFEPAAEGRGGSSTMPHKRNPVASIAICANHTRIVGAVAAILAGPSIQAERAAGSWQAEWETLRDLFILAAGSLERLRVMLEGLEVNPSQMKKNLDASLGLPMAESLTFALAARIGRAEAHRRVEVATRHALAQALGLADAAKADPAIAGAMTAAEIEQDLDPQRYLGNADAMIDAALVEARRAMED
jgi:3-carboxy-cis,cis-muconate cycloisomerase